MEQQKHSIIQNRIKAELAEQQKTGQWKTAEYQRFNLRCFKLVEVGQVVKMGFYFPTQNLISANIMR